MLNYKVAVKCLVYNHEKYLRDCLDGFVMQKTNFNFVVIVHDDASTDSSRQIISEYADKYPELIIPFFEKQNQYSLGAGFLDKALREALGLFPSQYLALCEGDDYWTEPDKLQRQVDFLDSHPDYSICFHKAIEHWDDGSKTDSNYCNLEGREYKLEEIFQVLTIPTAAAVFRRDIFESDYYKYVLSTVKTHFKDNMTWYCCSLAGKMMCMDFSGSIYRRQASGIAYSVNPLTHMRNNYEYFKVMKPRDRYLPRRQILFDIPQLLLDNRNCPSIRNEVVLVGKTIGIAHTMRACIIYYSKRIVKSMVSERIWIRLKKCLRSEGGEQ